MDRGALGPVRAAKPGAKRGKDRCRTPVCTSFDVGGPWMKYAFVALSLLLSACGEPELNESHRMKQQTLPQTQRMRASGNPSELLSLTADLPDGFERGRLPNAFARRVRTGK